MNGPRTGRGEDPTLLAAECEGSVDLQADVGMLVATSPGGDSDRIRSFAARTAEDAVDELGSSTDVAWRFFHEEPAELRNHDPRRPSEFLDRATHRTVEGPYDIVVVLTDVLLVSNGERFVPGLSAPLSRVAVVSTETLQSAPRDEPKRPLDHDADGGVMEPFQFASDRTDVPSLDVDVERSLHRMARETPAAEARPRGSLGRLVFHLILSDILT